MKKRWLLVIILSVIILAFILFSIFVLANVIPVPNTGDKYILGAHRGNSMDFIENTLPAFEDAVKEDKYNFIEFDIQYTKDKKIVAHHDLTLKRLQKINSKVKDLTYNELENLSKYHIPTYDEVMSIVAGKKPLNIEIKSQGNSKEDKQLADFVIADLVNKSILNSTLISSISIDLIRYINDKYNANYSSEWNLSKPNSYTYTYTPEYRDSKKYIDTGLIYYVHKGTFANYLCELTKYSGWETLKAILSCGYYNEMIQGAYWSGANYLMVHGANTRHNYYLNLFLPKNSKLIIWTFDDQMYIVLPIIKNWKEKYHSWSNERSEENLTIWWQD